MEITAAVLRDPQAPYALERLTLPPLRAHEVLVRIAAVGMCHTDALLRTAPFARELPIVPGHEGAGVVEETGAEVTHLQPGDHVVLSFDSCGGCAACADDRPFHCDTMTPRNLSGRDVEGDAHATDAHGQRVANRWFGQSSFATHAIATARNAVKVDAALPFELAAPLGCGLMTGAGTVLSTLRTAPTDRIAIFGAGAVGLASVMAAHIAGAERIIAIDLDAGRRELARELGATHAIDGRDPGLLKELRAHGVTQSVEATGVPQVAATAVACVRQGGTCAQVGVLSGPLELPPLTILGRRITGVQEGDVDPHVFLPRLITLHREGRFPIERLVTTYPLADIDRAEREHRVKPVLLPPGRGS